MRSLALVKRLAFGATLGGPRPRRPWRPRTPRGALLIPFHSMTPTRRRIRPHLADTVGGSARLDERIQHMDASAVPLGPRRSTAAPGGEVDNAPISRHTPRPISSAEKHKKGHPEARRDACGTRGARVRPAARADETMLRAVARGSARRRAISWSTAPSTSTALVAQAGFLGRVRKLSRGPSRRTPACRPSRDAASKPSRRAPDAQHGPLPPNRTRIESRVRRQVQADFAPSAASWTEGPTPRPARPWNKATGETTGLRALDLCTSQSSRASRSDRGSAGAAPPTIATVNLPSVSPGQMLVFGFVEAGASIVGVVAAWRPARPPASAGRGNAARIDADDDVTRRESSARDSFQSAIRRGDDRLRRDAAPTLLRRCCGRSRYKMRPAGRPERRAPPNASRIRRGVSLAKGARGHPQ